MRRCLARHATPSLARLWQTLLTGFKADVLKHWHNVRMFLVFLLRNTANEKAFASGSHLKPEGADIPALVMNVAAQPAAGWLFRHRMY